MALQSQTYANSGNAYYIRGADPIVPGDQAIIGPVEILPSDTSAQPLYYNRFIQTNASGLAIAEYKTLNNELLSDIILNPFNSILLTSRSPGEEAVLEVGVNPAQDAGRVTINANDGLVVKNLAGAGKGLQIYHDGPTNQNRLENVDVTPAGARMNFNVNTSDITFTNDVTADFMKISPQTNIFQVETPGGGLTAVTPGGVGFIGVGTNGRVGPFGGATVTLDSSQGVTIRTSSGVAPLPNYNTITANANGTVQFLSTITAPTVNALTGNISTINSSTINNTGNARIASVAVTNDNTGSSVPYSTYYGNYQGNLRYNTIRDTAGAPATAIESLEIINVAGGPQTGGIQFYTADNGTPANVKWMGGFLQNNVGGGQSEFRLASTITASMPRLVNLSTINNIPIDDFGVPPGTILNWAGFNANAIPTGYLLCDGQEVSQTTYFRLFLTIGSWGTAVNPANFVLPDSRGKVLAGSVTVPSNSGPNGPYRVSALYSSLTTISLPTAYGGGTRVGAIVTGCTGQLYPGMSVTTVGANNSAKIVTFINSDGYKGQSNGSVGPNTVFVVILFDIAFTTPTGSFNFTFEMNDVDGSNEAPYIRNSRIPIANPQPGIGSYGVLQRGYNVGAHTHVQLQPGAQSAPGVTWRAGDDSGPGPNTQVNNELFTYTDPLSGLSYTQPSAMMVIPNNIGAWQIIKY
jgi:microcystin-dependent protein